MTQLFTFDYTITVIICSKGLKEHRYPQLLMILTVVASFARKFIYSPKWKCHRGRKNLAYLQAKPRPREA